jgi:molybdopterin-binding protein
VNVLKGEIVNIESLERLNLITFKIGGQIVNVLMLEMNMDLEVGKNAELLIKPTAVSVSDKKCKFENCLEGDIVSIDKGKILSSVVVDSEGFKIESIMLNECVDFEKGKVYVYFKANDVAVGKVL